MCRIHLLWQSAVAALLAVGALGCHSSPPPPAGPPPAPVHAVHPWRQPLDEWAKIPGVTQPLPKHLAYVTAPVQGIVVGLLPGHATGATREGDHVQAEQVVAQLDDRSARNARDQAASAIKQAEDQAQQAANAVRQAQLALKRTEELHRSHVGNTNIPLASTAELQQARLALQNAQSQQQAAAEKVGAARSQLATLERQLSLYTLRAPISGWLGPIRVALGQTVSIGTIVAEVVDLDKIDVLCFVPPSRIGHFALGQPARIASVDWEKTTSPAGEVVFIAVQAEAATGSFALKARFDNAGLRLRANALVEIRVRTAPQRERLVLPTSALLDAEEPPVVVIVHDVRTEKGALLGKALRVRAILGVRNDVQHRVEILQVQPPQPSPSLPTLEQLWFVTSGGHGLEDGDEVRIQDATAEFRRPGNGGQP